MFPLLQSFEYCKLSTENQAALIFSIRDASSTCKKLFESSNFIIGWQCSDKTWSNIPVLIHMLSAFKIAKTVQATIKLMLHLKTLWAVMGLSALINNKKPNLLELVSDKDFQLPSIVQELTLPLQRLVDQLSPTSARASGKFCGYVPWKKRAVLLVWAL